MSILFNVEGKAVFPNPETLLLSPFKEIWERDKKKNKEFALEDLAYIEFISSMKATNPYRQYAENKKKEEVTKDIITRKNWKPDELIEKAIRKNIEFQTEASTTYSYYMAAKKVAEKMKDFFETVDINERNKAGMPVYKPADITRAINDTEKVLTNLKNLEKKVEEELYESVKTRNNKEISPFAKRPV